METNFDVVIESLKMALAECQEQSEMLRSIYDTPAASRILPYLKIGLDIRVALEELALLPGADEKAEEAGACVAQATPMWGRIRTGAAKV